MAVGGAAGALLSVVPFLLIHAYVRSFVSAASPDSGFNVFTLGALGSVLLAGALAVAALVMLAAKTPRVLGLAYLCGLLCGGAVDLLLDVSTMH